MPHNLCVGTSSAPATRCRKLPPSAAPGERAWLGEEPALADDLRALLKPYPAERMRAYPVSTKVNSVKNDDAGLIEVAA
jgi:putative SOS response-associated peptidase YedK